MQVILRHCFQRMVKSALGLQVVLRRDTGLNPYTQMLDDVRKRLAEAFSRCSDAI